MPKTLLVVDDSATMRKVFEMTFAGEDITVVTHDGGDSLLARAREARPAAVVVDVALGHTNGYDVCRALKGDDGLGRFPVLLLYSEQNPLDEARARDCGSDGSLVKPFDTQSAIDKVKTAMGVAASGPAAAAAPPGPARPAAPSPQAPAGPPRSPSSAGIAAVAPPQGVSAAPKATQGYAPGMNPPGAPPGMPPLSARQAPPAPAPAPKAAPSPEPDVEFEMGEEEAEAPATPPRGVPSPAHAPAPAPRPMAAAPAPAPAPARGTAPGPSHVAPVAASPAATLSAEVHQRVTALGLTPAQADAVAALTREVVERVVWEVVPQLAETVIREELRRLTE